MKLHCPKPSFSQCPLTAKVFAACAGLGLLILFVNGLILYRTANRALMEEVRARLSDIASTAATHIDPEIHRRINSSADEQSQAYRKIKSVLIDVKKANPRIRYVYTMRKTSKPNIWQFVVDAEQDPDQVSHVGDHYDVSGYPEMQKAFSGPIADREPATDKWGTWLSGYAPIRTSQGQAEAILGIDMSIDDLMHELSHLRRGIAVNLLAGLTLSVLLSLLIARVPLYFVRVFVGAADRVGDGDLDFQIPIRRSDEIGRFADAFNRMLVGLKESRDRLMEQSTRDFLTGVGNHMYFHDRLASELERAERYNRNLCLLIMDLDRFKSINDIFGHPIGDSLLKQLADVIRAEVRSIDIIARYGGDEFAVILPETEDETGMAVAERIREAVESHSFRAVTLENLLTERNEPHDARTISLTVTTGVAEYPGSYTTKDGLIMCADIALCRAKHIARNTVSLYDPIAADGETINPSELYRVLMDPSASAVRSLAAAVDAKDNYTHGHSERVTDYALLVGDALDLDPETKDNLKVAGLLHDLGKISVPDGILNKPTSLTQEERDTVRQHPAMGGNILRRAPALDLVIPAVLYHHERWDGKGYPDGLSGDTIPLMARILAIADSFDAMTSARPYRKAMSVEHALLELHANAGSQFDPNLVKLFAAALQSSEEQAAA